MNYQKQIDRVNACATLEALIWQTDRVRQMLNEKRIHPDDPGYSDMADAFNDKAREFKALSVQGVAQ